MPRKYAIQEPGTGWRERISQFKAAYAKRNLDHIHKDIEDKVYAMALDGATLPLIAQYFGVDINELRAAYEDVWAAGRAELQMLIRQDNVEFGLNSKIPVAKIWLAKSMGGLGEGEKSGTEADADDSGEVNLNIRVIKREPSES